MATIIEPEYSGEEFPDETRSPKPGPSPALRKKRLRPSGFSWRRHWPIVAVAVALGVFWLLPIFIAHTPIIDRVIQSAASDLHGTVRVKSASLGWFSPMVLRGVEVRGADGQPLLEIPEARGEASLLTMLFNKARLGHFRVHEPKLSVVLRDGGSNLEDAIAEYLKSTAPATMDIAVEITDGTVLVQDSRTHGSWQIDKLQLTWVDPLAPGKPAQGKVSGVVTEHSAPGGNTGGESATARAPARGQRTAARGPASAERTAGPSGKIDATLSLGGPGPRGKDQNAKPGRVNGKSEPGGVPSGSGPVADQATLKAENVPLAMFESLARRFVPGLRVDGRLTGTLEARWDGQSPDGKTTLTGRLTGEEVQLRLTALGKDQPKLAKIQASGQVVVQNGQAQCDRVSLETDVGSLSLNGRLDLRGSAGSSLAATLAQSWDVSGQLDLARLAALLPNTLRIHKSAQITSGQVQLKLSSRRGKEGMTWQGQLEAANLAAVRDGKKLLWQQPIFVTLAAHDTRQGAVIDSVECKSDFLSINASGTRDELSGSALFDFRKLADQAAGFMDLGGLGVTGDGWAQFRWKRSAQGIFDGTADLQVDRFQWALPDRQPWTETRLQANLAVTMRTDFDSKTQIDAAVLKLQTGEDQWEVRLAQPVAMGGTGVSPVASRAAKAPAPSDTWTLAVRSSGQLSQWQRRLAMWLAAHQWTLAGQYQFSSEVTLSPTTIAVRQAIANVDGLVVENPSWKVREQRVELSATGRWDRTGRRIELDSAGLKASTLAADAKKFLAYFPASGSPELSGTVTCNADLERLHAWVRLNLADQIVWRVAGTLSSSVEFQQTGGPIFAQFQAAINNLAMVHPSGPRYQEQEVRLTGRGSYNHLSRSVVIDEAKLTSGTLAGSASGRVAVGGGGSSTAGRTEMQISGRLDYDLQRIAELIRARYGDGIRLAGRGSCPIAISGPWSLSEATASASLNWQGADLYGFQVEPGELQASLARGVVQTQPLVLGVSEGRLQLVPRVQLAPGPAVFSLAPGRVAEQIRLTPNMCAFALKYLAPVLAGAVGAEGRFSIELDGCQVPLANPGAAEIAGRLTIHSAQVAPGPLLGELGAILGRPTTAQLARESVVPFQMTQGRVYHKDLTLMLGDLQVRTTGSVGLDETLSMVAEVPVQGQTLQLPITGTLRQPRVDRAALGQAVGQTIENAARGVIQDQFNRQLPGLLRPAPKR